MRAARRAIARPSLRVGFRRQHQVFLSSTRNPGPAAAPAVSKDTTDTDSAIRREPDQQDDRDHEDEDKQDHRHVHTESNHNDIVSKAIAVSAVEELQASNRILRDELHKYDIEVPKTAEVLENSARRHLDMAVTDTKLLHMRQSVQELLKVAKVEGDEDVLKAFCEETLEGFRRVMGDRERRR